MKSSSSLHKAESRFLMVVGTIVVLVGVPAVLSFLKSPDSQTEQVRRVENRAPASVDEKDELHLRETPVFQKHSHSTALIQFDCNNHEGSEEVHSSYVRIAGIPCREFEDLEITNKSNGFSAAVIFSKGNKFTTDFIDLRSGENSLEITATKADGSKITKMLKVVRRDIASVKQ